MAVQNDITGLQSARGLLIRQGISALTPPLSHDTLQLMLAEIDKRLESQIALFIGDVTKTSGTITCDLTPSAVTSAPSTNETVLFTVQNGTINIQHDRCFVPPALAGSIKGLTKTHDVRVTTTAASQFATNVKPRTTTGASGLYYRIPASATIAVQDTIGTTDAATSKFETTKRTLVRSDALVAQFGKINTLPRGADVHTFQSVVNATLTPTTGALQKLEFNITPKDTSTVNAVADAAGLVLDAQGKRAAAAEAARKAATDELSALEQKRKILEEKKKIADLEKELGTPP